MRPAHLLLLILLLILSLTSFAICSSALVPCAPPTISPPDGSAFDPTLPRIVVLFVFAENVSLTRPNAPNQPPVPLDSFTSASLSDWFALSYSPVYLRDQGGTIRVPLDAAVVLDANGVAQGDRFRALFSPSLATELYVLLQRAALVGANGSYPAASLARYQVLVSPPPASCAAGSIPCASPSPVWPAAPPPSPAAEQSTLTALAPPVVASQLCDPFLPCAWQLRLQFAFQGSGTLAPYQFDLIDLEILLPGDPLPYVIASNVSLFVARSDALLSVPAQALDVQVHEASVEERGGVGSEPQPGDDAWLPLWRSLALWSPSSYAQLLADATVPGASTIPASFSPLRA